MIPIPEGLVGREVDLGATRVTPEMIRRYAAEVGDEATLCGEATIAPPTFCLVLHRGMHPEVPLPDEMFGVYGGHDLELLEPIRAGRTYRAVARITDIFEKNGRTGRLVVVEREVRISDTSGVLAARIVERQIIRRKPPEKE